MAQFAIGFLHHQKFKKTQQPTIYKTIHVWLGHIVIALGTCNAFMYVRAPSCPVSRKLTLLVASPLP